MPGVRWGLIEPVSGGAVVRLPTTARPSLSGSTLSPHSAGIPGPIVVEAVRDMRLGV